MADAAKVLRDGLAAFNNKDLTTAERLFKRVIKADPSNAAALNLITVTMMATGRFAEAQPYIERATSINPSSDVSFYNYGIILKHLNSPRQALEKFTKALALNPNVAATWNNRGATYNDLGEHHAALRDFDKAISLNRAYAEAYTNLGNTLVMLKRSLDAVVAYQKALSINPRLAEALFGLGNSFYDLNRYDEAFHAYDGAFSINPHLSDVEGARLHTKMRLCDWNALEVDLNRLTASIRSGKPVCGPFALLSLTDSPEDHLSCARAWTTKRHPSASKPMARGGPFTTKRFV